MQQRDFDEFRELMNAVYAFYGKDISPFALDVWWKALLRFDIGAIRNALSLHCQDPDRGQWLPKPADVVRLLDGGSGDRSLQAWSKVERAIRQVGPWQSVVFDDPVIHAVITDMGGWIQLCQVTDDELPFRANEFRKRYQGYALRGCDAFPKALTGIAEAHNRAHGCLTRHDEPLAIGDAGKCAMVFMSGHDQQSAQPVRISQALDVAAIEQRPVTTKAIQHDDAA